MKPFFTTYRVVLLLMLSSLLGACQRELEDLQDPKAPSSQQHQLGQQLKNPYTVAVMQQAYDNLWPTLQSSELEVMPTHQQVHTTHLYVRFHPANEEELDLLKADTTLKCYTYPLDYALPEGEGKIYHDPNLSPDQPDYQYTTVPAGYEHPRKLEFEVLAKLYIPELDKEFAATGKVEMLVDEALRLTGNLDEKGETAAKGQATNSFNPQGTIRVFDTKYNALIPLAGVKVRARRWFTIEEVLTNNDGYFYIGRSFSRDVNYAVFYERHDFDIRSGTFGQAYYDGPKKSGQWNLDIYNGPHRFYAHIFRAAADYYYRYPNQQGIKAPPRNSFWSAAVKIGAYDEPADDALGSHCKDCRPFGILPRLYIYSKNPNGVERESDNIYATTIHELAHSSHWEFRRNNWTSTEKRLKESWADGMEWALTYGTYGTYGDDAARTDNYQNRQVSVDTYTPLIVDLLDYENQRFTRGHSGSSLWPNDNVFGYNPVTIENAMHGANTFTDLKNNLRNNSDNPSEGNLDELFSNWP